MADSTMTCEGATEPTITTIGDLLEQYEIYNRSRSKKKRQPTLERYKYSLGHFQSFMGAGANCRAISQSKLDHYRLYLIDKDLSTISINDYLRDLGTMLKWATMREYLGRCPVIEYLIEDEPEAPIVFDEEEYQDLLTAANKEKTPVLRTRAKAMTMMLYSTGVRASELCGARWADIDHILVDGEEGHILRVQGAKRGRKRVVVLLPEVWAAIKEYRDELAQPHGRGAKVAGSSPAWLFVSSRQSDGTEPMTVSGLRAIFSRLEKVSGVHANPHKFRHSWAQAFMNSAPEEEALLMELAGWKTRDMIKVYGRYQTDTLVRAAKKHSPNPKAMKGGNKDKDKER